MKYQCLICKKIMNGSLGFMKIISVYGGWSMAFVCDKCRNADNQ